jgi:hypothetical protein
MSRRSNHHWRSLLASLPAFVACAPSGVSYSGDSQRKLLDPARLGSGDEAPPGQRRLGHLSAGCRLADIRAGADGVTLSDVGCSTALLQAALRERAANAGGTFLVDLRCDPGHAPLAPGGHAQCSADVWGPREPGRYPSAPSPVPVNVDPRGPAAPLAPAFGAVSEAWRVLVDYWPAPGQKARAPVAPERVSEIDFPRVGFVRLGDVRARADASCSKDTLRGAVRAAAARVGATSIVDVRCVAGEDAQLCIASLAALELDAPVAQVP